MASESLHVPEESLTEVIAVIRNGLVISKKISRDTRRNLKKWCDEMEEYVKELTGADEDV